MAISHANHPARLAALAAGLPTFEGKRCSHQHQHTSTSRYTSTGACIGCQSLRDKGAEPKTEPHQVSAKCPAPCEARQHTEAAERRFKRPAFGHTIDNYQRSVEGRQRSHYLDKLIRKIA